MKRKNLIETDDTEPASLIIERMEEHVWLESLTRMLREVLKDPIIRKLVDEDYPATHQNRDGETLH